MLRNDLFKQYLSLEGQEPRSKIQEPSIQKKGSWNQGSPEPRFRSRELRIQNLYLRKEPRSYEPGIRC
jgi:hypothetical protein